MYAYTARAGSSCQHIGASCRQCATTRLKSVVPRPLRQSRLLSLQSPIALRSYASRPEPLDAWLHSVNSKHSEPQESRPSQSEPTSPSKISGPSKRRRKAQAIATAAAILSSPPANDLVKALKDRLAENNKERAKSADVVDEGQRLEKQNATVKPALGPTKAPKGRETVASLEEVKKAIGDTGISPRELASALGATANFVPVEAVPLSNKEQRGAEQSATSPGKLASPSTKRIKPKSIHDAPTAVASETNFSAKKLRFVPMKVTVGRRSKRQGTEISEKPQSSVANGDVMDRIEPAGQLGAEGGSQQKKHPQETSEGSKDGLPLRRVIVLDRHGTHEKYAESVERREHAVEKYSAEKRDAAMEREGLLKKSYDKRKAAMEDFRKRSAGRGLRTPPVILRSRRESPPSIPADVKRSWPAERDPALLQKLYRITQSVANVQAQKLLLQFLEQNHELLGEHGAKLIDAHRIASEREEENPFSNRSVTKLKTTFMEAFQTLEQALTENPAKPAQKIPEMSKKGNIVLGEVNASDLSLKPIDVPQPPVPGVVYGLDRVLFNPGVYQLRDEHSKVYNFDPYLETITPVKEFDFSALKEYITSSRDTALIDIATQEHTKYTGSTSSMTSVLAHFHYLLSKWRPLNMNHLSRGFPDPLTSFSAIQREPTGIFLRWRDGVYAIDANKEFDSANVLMYLGKSMEKFLTAEKDVYEKFRKDQSHKLSDEEKDTPESYHYTTMGDFLMRSQLDAYDPRLPGTGMFDLKTRAVVSIRKDATDFEPGLGYEIRKSKGEFESFEREYYDLCRAAFMKYSLQARMGRMDGIFVAFHNIERIFGFQYLPIGVMDEALHGTTDTTLGDQEFKVSVSMLNKALDMFTEKFPGQSLQIDFETRPLNAAKDDCVMYIVAQPVTEDRIKAIQERNLATIQEYERQVVGLDSKQQAQFLIDAINKETEDAEVMDEAERLERAIEKPFDPKNIEILKAAVHKMNEHDTATENAVHKALELVEERLQDDVDIVTPVETAKDTFEEVNAEEPTVDTPEKADTTEKIAKSAKSMNTQRAFEDKPLMGLQIRIRNYVNGQEVLRPENLCKDDTWEVRYAIEDLQYAQAAKKCKMMAARKFLVNVQRKKKQLAGEREYTYSQQRQQNHFLGAIEDAVKKGKEYREKQNQEDIRLGVKSLADTLSVFEPVKVQEVPKQAEETVFTKEAQEAPKEAVSEPAKQEVTIEEAIPGSSQQEGQVEDVKAEESTPESPKEEAKEETKEKPWWML